MYLKWLNTSAGEDYIALDLEILIAAGMSVYMIELSILDDLIVEGDEQFSLLLSTDDVALTISTEMATVNIQDDDSKK